ncbi:MAG: molybdopterin molybdotransferase MoeA [Lachnospiraceae bacterium]|nr:molybdopterin molybdotransferase MoeA [Lachnospiraceae bacterium]
MEFNEAVKILSDKVNKVDKENVSIDSLFGRILAEDLISKEDVPSFNRSPLDGYCFNYEDTLDANENNPSILDVIEVVPCGKVATKKIGKMQAIKVLTGAKIPEGGNAVVKFEDVEENDGKIKIFDKFEKNQNLILSGEDVKKGTVLAKVGDVIDAGVVGLAASLGISSLCVYRKVKVGFISTGSEVLELDDKMVDGKIYNSNRYIFDAIFKKNNIDYKYYGVVDDDEDNTVKIFERAIAACDIVISTGGVSVGDYDLVASSLEKIGLNIFVDRIEMKPGMACCFAEKNQKFVLALSGNPMSSVTTFYAVCLPAIRKMMGYGKYENQYFKVKLKNSFSKRINNIRFLRGKLSIENGEAVVDLNLDQGNIVIKSLIDCNAMIKAENVKEAKAGMSFDCMLL